MSRMPWQQVKGPCVACGRVDCSLVKQTKSEMAYQSCLARTIERLTAADAAGFKRALGVCIGEIADQRGGVMAYLDEDSRELAAAALDGAINRIRALVPAPATTPQAVPVFQRGDDERNEVCLGCGKHIRYHYGLTEYRCYPKPDAPF